MKCPHCETEIDEHEASRCMDAWVAEAVFGVSRIRLKLGLLLEKHAYKVSPTGYSTDIAAAWDVVEKLSDVRLIKVTLPVANPWMVEVPTNEIQVTAATAPLAICRAALKAAPISVVKEVRPGQVARYLK